MPLLKSGAKLSSSRTGNEMSLQAHQQRMSNVYFPSLTQNTQPHNMNPSSGSLTYARKNKAT